MDVIFNPTKDNINRIKFFVKSGKNKTNRNLPWPFSQYLPS